MEYYIISFIISLVVFIFVYLCDYKKPINEDENNIIGNEDRSLFTKNNFLLFGIIYIVITIISFYTFTSSISLSSLCPVFISSLLKAPEPSPIINKDNGDEIDPKILSKITENIDIGFNPPDMEKDEKDIKEDIDNV
jgi:ABC-type transport system involved in multi-copper enzyme maturation permease subunit